MQVVDLYRSSSGVISFAQAENAVILPLREAGNMSEPEA
jgi:hypothetical protein